MVSPLKIENRQILYASTMSTMAEAVRSWGYSRIALCAKFRTQLSLLLAPFRAPRGGQQAVAGGRHARLSIDTHDSTISKVQGGYTHRFLRSDEGRLPPSHRPTQLSRASRGQRAGQRGWAQAQLALHRRPGEPRGRRFIPPISHPAYPSLARDPARHLRPSFAGLGRLPRFVKYALTTTTQHHTVKHPYTPLPWVPPGYRVSQHHSGIPVLRVRPRGCGTGSTVVRRRAVMAPCICTTRHHK